MYKPEGVTVLINMNGLTRQQLIDARIWKKAASELTTAVGLQPFIDTFSVKKFLSLDGDTTGITFSIVLAESHLCGHTWGEHGYMRLELSSCKKIATETISQYLAVAFPKAYHDIRQVAW